MAIIRCGNCDTFVDDDWNPCEDVGGELVCTDCAVELEEEAEHEQMGQAATYKRLCGVSDE